jgi:hypothetical protein
MLQIAFSGDNHQEVANAPHQSSKVKITPIDSVMMLNTTPAVAIPRPS